MTRITTHILDTSSALPAATVRVWLDSIEEKNITLISETHTDAAGRAA